MNLRKSQFLVGLGWVLAALALYADFLLLELDWNLRSWQPALDAFAVGLILGLPALLTVFWFLARKTTGKINRALSLLICLGLAVLAVYTLTAETMSSGMFAREVPSPLWYRAGRFIVLFLPSCFWVACLERRRAKTDSPGEAR